MVSAAASKRLETRSALATSPALRTAKPSKNAHIRPDTQPDDHDKLFRHTRRAGRGCSLLLEAFWLQLLDPEFRRLREQSLAGQSGWDLSKTIFETRSVGDFEEPFFQCWRGIVR